MTSDFRVGRGGVQNGPRKLDVIGLKSWDMVGRGVQNHQKSSDVIYGRSHRIVGGCQFDDCVFQSGLNFANFQLEEIGDAY